jgi:hypothetical protein
MNTVELIAEDGRVLCWLRASEIGHGLRIDCTEILDATWLSDARSMRVLDAMGAVVHEAPLEKLHEA